MLNSRGDSPGQCIEILSWYVLFLEALRIILAWAVRVEKECCGAGRCVVAAMLPFYCYFNFSRLLPVSKCRSGSLECAPEGLWREWNDRQRIDKQLYAPN